MDRSIAWDTKRIRNIARFMSRPITEIPTLTSTIFTLGLVQGFEIRPRGPSHAKQQNHIFNPILRTARRKKYQIFGLIINLIPSRYFSLSNHNFAVNGHSSFPLTRPNHHANPSASASPTHSAKSHPRNPYPHSAPSILSFLGSLDCAADAHHHLH